MPTNSAVLVTEMQQDDVPFLFALWRNRQVMRYADEFPRFRGWSRRDDPATAWQRYQEKRGELGKQYTQLIGRLPDGTRIGESFFAPLVRKLGEWRKPRGVLCVIGDIKLLPEYWGRGLGTQAMRQVVRFAFDQAGCEVFVVPPNENNPAAIQVYTKAGFTPIVERSPWVGHLLMTLTRDRYLQHYGCVHGP
jgi:RimJ/RimL family protein N-acetyltransferase